MTKLHLTSAALSVAVLLAAVACSPDGPAAPKLARSVKSALADAPGILEQAEAGTLRRLDQDLLVRFERQLPGFGGLYLDHGAVKVYMKTGTVPLAIVRSVLSSVYSAHHDVDVREAMKNAATATVIPGEYSLSELIAIQQRVEASFSGWTAVGTNIAANKVVVAFSDSGALLSALATMESAGVPAGALTGMVAPRATLTTVYFLDNVRPTRGGLAMGLGNDTYEPHTYKWNGSFWSPVYWQHPCSLGFNVHAASGDYFMTAGHCQSQWRGVNGATGDTVFQDFRGLPPLPNNMIGLIAIDPPYDTDLACPNGVGAYYDFCTDADVALGQYTGGASGNRQIGVSTYGGVNGNPGSSAIKNWYSITRVLPPEYVDLTMRHEVVKSGGTTYTTSGPFVADMADFGVGICWPERHDYCGTPFKTLNLVNQTWIQADVLGGDSGGPVFTGDPGTGAPYAALGIVVGRQGPSGLGPSDPCPSCTMIFSRWSAIEARVGIGTLDPRTTIP